MSDEMKSYSFNNTLDALSILESQLKCSACNILAPSPCILGGCEHIFCHVCVEKYLGASCPQCHIPAHVKDADVNRQLFNIASLCQKLRDVLSAPAADDVQADQEAAECTPKQPIKDVYHFDTPTDTPTRSKSANQKRARQKCNIGQQQNKKAIKKTDNITDSRAKNDETDKKVEGRNDNNSNLNGKRKRNTSLPKTRDAVPGDQSTMTQFYDYDDDDDDDDDEHSRINLSEFNSDIRAGIDDNVGSKRIDESIKPDIAEKVKKKRNKAAEIITEICKTTTRLRRKSDTDVKTLANNNAAERTNWFEDGSAMDIDNEVGNLVDHPNTSKKDNCLTQNTTEIQKMPKKSNFTRSKRSKSLSNGETGLKDATLKVEVTEQSENESNEATPVKEVATASKAGRKTLSKVPSGRKSGTPKSLKSKPTQKQISMLKDSSSPGTPTNKPTLKRSRASGSPAGVSPRTTLSPSNRTTPQRSKVKDVPAALSPAFNKRNAKGETPLQVAAIKNDEKKVAELLAAGANPNVRDNAGWSPLHEACNRGHAAVARMLLDNGAMMNVPGLDNDTPLHDAVSNGRIDCVKLLISRGASLSARNLQGHTPEDLAVTEVMKKALKTAIKNNTSSSVEEQVPLDTLEYQQPCLMGTSLSREQKVVLQKCASLLSAKQSEECTPEVTHVVTSCNDQGLCARTIKYLQAVLTGKWILSMDWVNTCLEFGSKVCEEGFEVQGTSTNPTSQAPLKGRMNRKQQRPGLFDGCQFYFHGNFEFSVPSKDDLVEVIKSGSGKILSREPKPGHLDSLDLTVPYHANPEGNLAHCCVFIVHQNLVEFQPIRTKHMCSVPVSWVLESAAEFKLQDL